MVLSWVCETTQQIPGILAHGQKVSFTVILKFPFHKTETFTGFLYGPSNKNFLFPFSGIEQCKQPNRNGIVSSNSSASNIAFTYQVFTKIQECTSPSQQIYCYCICCCVAGVFLMLYNYMDAFLWIFWILS